MSKYIKKDKNGFYVFDEIEFLKTLPTGLEYFAVDKETEQIYNLGFNYKEKMEKQITDLEAKLAESESEIKMVREQNGRVIGKLDLIVRSNQELEKQLAEKDEEIERLLIARELLLSDLHYARMDCEKTNRQIREFDKSCGDIINNLITQIEQTNETKRLKENK